MSTVMNRLLEWGVSVLGGRRRRRAGVFLGVAALMSVVVTGCSSSGAGDADTGPWAAEIAAAQSASTSDFEREVFEDGQISADENREAASRWQSCMNDKGYNARFEESADGSFQYGTDASPDRVDQESADNEACSTGTIAVVSMLYSAMLTNPENVDFNELYASCFVRNGVVEAPFSGEDYRKALETAAPDGSNAPWDQNDPAYLTCITDPAQ